MRASATARTLSFFYTFDGKRMLVLALAELPIWLALFDMLLIWRKLSIGACCATYVASAGRYIKPIDSGLCFGRLTLER